MLGDALGVLDGRTALEMRTAVATYIKQAAALRMEAMVARIAILPPGISGEPTNLWAATPCLS